ncbi:PREDICTED: transmembrane channel-like protein 3 [Wasmannia auropunctata]|uniref:transmembrane channel-like protein 3 n=1 Tax=Wasmannia auropunctata TaxID=64793 RepID=UPI0005F065CE|nr:PREDICTED: transmembrane channel-like protein 3 [Wasmannia auropunctata]
MQVGPSSSPQPSTSRQSVTFGIVECQNEDLTEEDERSRSERTDTKFHSDKQRISIAAKRASPSGTSRKPATMDKSTANSEKNDSEDDYSASVCAIMQQQNSAQRQSQWKRCPSSPFGADNVARHRSSVYTTSSGDTIIPMEESSNQEQIFEDLNLHKEILSGTKQQPWPLRRKIKLVRQAKAYIRRHEGVLQERLAQSHSTKDVIARVSLFMTKKWQYFRRELINLQTWLIPWEVRIMEIKSHFGSAVASYFIFLRWLFWINFVIAATLTAFVVIPAILIADAKLAGERKDMLDEEKIKSKNLWMEFEEFVLKSPFFYGWYPKASNSNYNLSLAYFVTNLVVYTYSFVAILRKMAENSRLIKLTEKEDEYIFSWKLFTGWDFMIGNPEIAHNCTASIMLCFKEALLEQAVKQKNERNWRIIAMRIFVNVAVLSLLALSAFAVIQVVERSKTESQSWWRQNEITINRHNCFHSALPSLRHETLNPFLDYKDYLDYETVDTNSGNESFYYEEKDTQSAVDNEILYDTNSTAIDNFLTDSTIAEHYYTSSTLFESETTTSTTIESDTMEDSSETNDFNLTEGAIITPSSSDSETSSVRKFNVTSIIAETTPITTYISESSSTLQSKRVIPLSKDNCEARCYEKSNCTATPPKNLSMVDHRKLLQSCWETMFGQELTKLTVMDLIFTILAILIMDFFRAVFVRFMNNCWCWDLEKQFPQYGDFKIAENILHLVINQGMVWMGMFFSPGLTALNLFKLGVLMYLRSWAVLTCNIPHEVVFRVSRSNNFYFALLLFMLFLCVLPVGYAIVWVEPSWFCGPFSGCPKIYNLATQSLINPLPEEIQQCLDYVASPGIVIPLIVFMMLIIYYMASLARSLREANNDLKMQLRHERTEERRKLFKIAEKRHIMSETSLSRWKKILPALRQARLSRNLEIVQKDNIQIGIGNMNTELYAIVEERLTNDTEEDSHQNQVLSNYDNEQRAEELDDLILNDIKLLPTEVGR